MNPRIATRDTILSQLSENIDDDTVLETVLDEIERSTADATIRGPGVMVDFDDYLEVAL